MSEDDGSENVRMTMTITDDTKRWLLEEYPDALELTECVRMAIGDAREYSKVRSKVERAEYNSD
jgi:hypothetical protein